MREGTPYDLTLRFTTALGNSLWVRTIGKAEKTDGKVTRVYGYIADVTERKNADEEIEKYREHLEEVVKARTYELETSRKMLYTLIDSLPDEIYAKDMEGRFILANRNVLNSFGLSVFSALMGKTDFDFLPCAEAEKEHEKERSVLRPDGQMINYIEHGKNRYGEERWLSVTKVPMRDINGNVTGLVGINRDITGLKVTEENLVKAKEEAEVANKAKSQFLSSMSHEIRTPLNAILGFSELMQMDDELPQKHMNWVRTINQSGEHLLTLINDILEISRIEAGRITFNPVSFNLVFLLREVESMFRMKAESKGIQLVLDISNNLPTVIVTDQIKLRQILINLAGNAVKFTNEGTVSIRARAESRGEKFSLTVEVEDTGPGIANKDMELLFRKFGQTGNGIKEGGTGLGLAISREYAKIMGGDIKVTSEEHRGSLFVLTVDVEIGDEFVRKEDSKKVVSLKPGQKKYKVLIVDDRSDNRVLLREILVPAGFETEEAEDGSEALEKFRAWQPDIILMDMHMPGKNGYDAAREIKESSGGKNTPVIAITASVFDDAKEKALDAGVDEYLLKPFKETDLFECISSCIDAEYIYK